MPSATMDMPLETTMTAEARPYQFSFPRDHTALLIIDMQRDFVQPGGFGSSQSVDMTAVQATIPYVQRLLALFRSLDMPIVHTREGHVPDLSDCPSSKLLRNVPTRAPDCLGIGVKGPMGRLLVRGEFGQDIVDELKPLAGEVVIDKPGKGAFWNTSLMDDLRARAVTHLIVCGVTTECCFTTTIREANDRGFECCGVIEATAGYIEDFKAPSIAMLNFAGGLFGFTASFAAITEAFQAFTPKDVTTNGLKNGDSEKFHETGTPSWNGDVSISALKAFYKSGGSIATVVDSLYDRIEAYKKIDDAVWIHLESRIAVKKAAVALELAYPNAAQRPALYGIPFTVKDSLDVANIPTTTACPPLAYTPNTTARVCQKVLSEGALFLGKVNLDQFATGLSGCRSSFGVTHSVFSPAFISGGSSSGSAVSVGARLCSFSIATDTAGSGRVPSGFNGVVGFKPTRGTISTVGLVPACPSLDCIAIIAANVTDIRKVWYAVAEYDNSDPYAKWAVSRPRPVHSIGPKAKSFRFGVPPANVLAQCIPTYQQEFKRACEKLISMGGVLEQNADWSPFQKAGDLLYDGTFVSERLATLPDGWLQKNKDALHPVVRDLLLAVEARQSTAVQAYRDLIAKAQYTREAETVFRAGDGGINVLVVPTTPTHWTIEEMQADPIKRNAFLGTFTHFGNVLDLCAVAAPAGEYDARELGDRCPSSAINDKLPFGVTFIGMSGSDAEVLQIAKRFGDLVGTQRSFP